MAMTLARTGYLSCDGTLILFVQRKPVNPFGAAIMKSLLKKAAIVGCLVVSGLASAATTHTSFALGTLGAEDTFAHLVGKGQFSDTYNFTLATGFTYDLVLDLNNVTGTAKQNEKFQTSGSHAFAYALYSGNTAIPGGTGNFGSNLSVAALAAGNSYSIVVSGQGKEDDSKYVTGLLSITSHLVASVPEPETYAMLLAGLGLMGTIARRRQS